MREILRRVGRDGRGANIVEMTLIMGILLILAAGVADLGRAFHSYIVITNAAREGARYGSRLPWDPDGIVAAVQAEAADAGVTFTEITVECRAGLGGGAIGCSLAASGDTIGVTVGKDDFQTFMGIFFGAGDLTLRYSAEMIVFGLDPD